MNDANHIGDLNEMVVGDNDHGDAIPEPKCGVCGIPWVSHMGIMGVCLWNKALMEDLVNLRKDNAQLYKERDEADFSLSRILSEISCRIEHGADSNGHLEGIYELFKKEKTP